MKDISKEIRITSPIYTEAKTNTQKSEVIRSDKNIFMEGNGYIKFQYKVIFFKLSWKHSRYFCFKILIFSLFLQ